MDDRQLLAAGEMLAAIVQGAAEEFVRVPYGASHEDVANINDWHSMAKEALTAWAIAREAAAIGAAPLPANQQDAKEDDQCQAK